MIIKDGCPCENNCCDNPDTHTPEHHCIDEEDDGWCDKCYCCECRNCGKQCYCDL